MDLEPSYNKRDLERRISELERQMAKLLTWWLWALVALVALEITYYGVTRHRAAKCGDEGY